MKIKEMLIQCIDVDIQNIGSNGFNNIDEVLNWYKTKNNLTIIKIYNDYYGLIK